MAADLMVPDLSEQGDPRARFWQEAALRWLNALGSEQSREKYGRILAAFFAFVSRGAPMLPSEVSGADCYRWKDWMEQERHLQPTTVANRLAIVSSFFAFACTFDIGNREMLCTYNPMAGVKRPDVDPYAHAKGLAPAEIKLLLASCDQATEIGARDYAILLWMLFTARRRGAVTKLTWGDIRDGRTAGLKEYFYSEKGNRTGWRDLPPPVWEATLAYLTLSERLSTMKRGSPMFTATNDHALRLPVVQRAMGLDNIDDEAERALSQQVLAQEATKEALDETSLNKLVTRAALRAGLSEWDEAAGKERTWITVHTLRHTAAQLRLHAGDDILAINQFLDHGSLDVTKIYVNAVSARPDSSWRRVADQIL